MSNTTCQECSQLQKEFEKNPRGKPISRTGLAFVAVTGGAAVALSVICLPFVTPAFRRVCLPYVPATSTQVSNVLKALEGRSGSLVDIGSGDGRIVLEASRQGFRSHGIELNPWLVAYSKFTSWRSGLASKATFARQDLWRSDLKPYDNVVIFGVKEMMPSLEEKLERELDKQAVVVACRFPFPNWKPDQEIGVGIDTVWVYQKNK